MFWKSKYGLEDDLIYEFYWIQLCKWIFGCGEEKPTDLLEFQYICRLINIFYFKCRSNYIATNMVAKEVEGPPIERTYWKGKKYL